MKFAGWRPQRLAGLVEATEDGPRWRLSGGRGFAASRPAPAPPFTQPEFRTIRPILHPVPFFMSFSIIITFYWPFFLHQSKRFSTEKSDILRGNLLMWDRPGCNIGWRRDGVGSIIFQRPPPAAATPTLFIINLEHFYLAQSYTAFYSAMNVILLPSSGGT